MLSALLTMSALTSVLMVKDATGIEGDGVKTELVFSEPNSKADLIEQQSAFFISQANGYQARVKALKHSAKPASKKACRHALTLPMRQSIKSTLSNKLKLGLPKAVDFVQAEISQFKYDYQAPWVICEGQVIMAEPELNEAGLAIRLAWYSAKVGDKSMLRPLLNIAMKHPMTQADAVALIASQSKAQAGEQYLDKYLVADELVLSEAKLAVANIWFQQAKFQQVVDLLDACDESSCHRLVISARDELEKLEEASVDDLSSYF